jgi:phytoene/squalene synthetase
MSPRNKIRIIAPKLITALRANIDRSEKIFPHAFSPCPSRPRHYATYEDLRANCWRVACAVGLVSIRIFGYTDPASDPRGLAMVQTAPATRRLTARLKKEAALCYFFEEIALRPRKIAR